MPLNNYLPDLELPVEFKEGPAITDFLKHLESINVTLIDFPTIEQLRSYIPQFCTATWTDSPHNNFFDFERDVIIKELFEGKLLPTALETIGLTFLISNIDLVDVTHLLRHRSMSFSAVCTADRDQRHDKCLVKESILLSPEFIDRYIKIVSEAKQLYADMVDSREISILDARTILPRSLESHYYCRGNIKDILNYIRQRLDRQIQPESDNIVALQMWIELVSKYPMIKDLIDINAPDKWYVNTVPTGRSSNIYMPEKPRNDVFDYKEQWFLYKKQRSEMRGGQYFLTIWNKLIERLQSIC